VAVNVLKFYPLPNQTGNPVTGLNNYSKTGAHALDVDNFDLRVDRNMSKDGRGFVRYSFRKVQDVPAITFPDDIDTPYPSIPQRRPGADYRRRPRP
jgi:hypothetical protein